MSMPRLMPGTPRCQPFFSESTEVFHETMSAFPGSCRLSVPGVLQLPIRQRTAGQLPAGCPGAEELTQSELWQQAVHSGSLISYEEEPITTKAMAEEATASLAKKGGTVRYTSSAARAIPPPAPGFSAKTPARRSPSPEVKHRTGSPPPNRNRPIPSLSPSSPAMGSSPPRPAAARTLASGR